MNHRLWSELTILGLTLPDHLGVIHLYPSNLRIIDPAKARLATWASLSSEISYLSVKGKTEVRQRSLLCPLYCLKIPVNCLLRRENTGVLFGT